MHYLPCDTTQDSPIPGGCGSLPTTSSTLVGSANSSSRSISPWLSVSEVSEIMGGNCSYN